MVTQEREANSSQGSIGIIAGRLEAEEKGLLSIIITSVMSNGCGILVWEMNEEQMEEYYAYSSTYTFPTVHPVLTSYPRPEPAHLIEPMPLK